MEQERPLLLVCNDDGIDAPGIRALAEALVDLGDVYVVAPATEQSAVGHAITVRDPVRARQWPEGAFAGVKAAYAVSGTPADCVKLALAHLVPRRPTLVCSGINNGPNTAVSVIYSGTVSAATEGTLLGVDSVAFSQCAWGETDFAESARWARQIAGEVLARGLPPGILLNVNLPYRPEGQVEGVRVTRLARARWEESYDSRTDPYNEPYFWSLGKFVKLDEGLDTDLAAIEDGFVSVTPIHYDLTAYEALAQVSAWIWNAPPSK